MPYSRWSVLPATTISTYRILVSSPIIGHLTAEGHLGRCHLKGRAGDAATVILSAVGYNFRRILAWLRALGASS